MHNRRKARIAALQTLFERDSSDHDVEVTLTWLTQEHMMSDEAISYARELIRGVVQNKAQIDALISIHAPTWPVQQLSAVDRNILRLAIFEILIDNKVPLKAAINEAVELAKSFGSYNSSKFINGVLRTISQIQINTH